MPSSMDFSVQRFLNIKWYDLDLERAKQAAYELMDGWDWKDKVISYKEKVSRMTNVNSISMFMENCIVKGIRYKAMSNRNRTKRNRWRKK